MAQNGNAVAPRAQEAQITELPRHDPAALMEQVLVKGDLSNLTKEELAQYVVTVCQSVGINPLTKPFEVLELDGKLVLYPNRGATDQIAKLYGVDRKIVSREVVDGIYVVTAQATDRQGRTDEAIGAVPIVKEDGAWERTNTGKNYFRGNGTFRPLSPGDKANAMMKAETKAKRRAILSLIGLPLYDDAEFTEAALNASARVEMLPSRPVANPAVKPIAAVGHVEAISRLDAAGRRANAGTEASDRHERDDQAPPGAAAADAERVDEMRNLHRVIAPLFDGEEDKHAAIRDLAAASWGVGSLADLPTAKLRILRRWAEDQDPLGSQIKLDYARAIDRAKATGDLALIWREIKGAGATDDMLTAMCGRKGEELKRLAAAPASNGERAEAIKAINAAVRKAFGQVEDAKSIRDDLVCDRYGLQDFKAATPEQLWEAAEAVAGWSADWAPKAREWLRLVAGAANETMATDVARLLEEGGIDDAFVAAALSDALARFEDETEALRRIGAAVDRAVATGA
jgi:hypothetical protein